MVTTEQLISEVVIKDSASAVADRITAATTRMADAEAKVQDTTTRSTRSIEQAAKGFESLRRTVDPVYSAQQRLADQQLRLNDYVAKGVATETEAAAVFQRLREQTDNLVNSFNRAGSAGAGSFGHIGFAIQNAGFQIGDFAVQVASGGGVLRPLIQQGTQLISMFGPWGAVIGAAGAVVGALATSFIDTKNAENDAAKAADEYTKALEAADEIARKLKGDNQETVEALQAERRYRLQLADAAMQEAQAKIDAAKASTQKALTGIDDLKTGDVNADVAIMQSAEKAKQQLDQLTQIQKDIIAQQRQIAAELQYGGEMMDPFAAQGSDHSSDYYKPQAKTTTTTRPTETKDIDDQRSALADLVDKMQQEQQLLQTTGEAREQLNRQREIDAALAQGQAAAEKDYQAGLRDTEILTSQELQNIKDMAGAHYDLEKAQEASAESAKQAAKASADLAAQNKKAATELSNFMDQSVDRIGSAITQFTVQTGDAFESFKGVALGVLSEIEQELIKLALINPLKNALSGTSANPTLSSLLDSLFGGSTSGALSGGGPRGFADGGIMTRYGPVPLRTYSAGGVTSSPQMALFGEGSVPEAYVPVPSGKIPVEIRASNDNQRSGGTIVNVIDQRQNGADIQSQQTTGPNGQKQIDILVRDSVSRQIGQGVFDKTLGARFGSQVQPTVKR